MFKGAHDFAVPTRKAILLSICSDLWVFEHLNIWISGCLFSGKHGIGLEWHGIALKQRGITWNSYGIGMEGLEKAWE